MSFKDYFKTETLTFQNFYQKLKSVNPQTDFREKVLKETGMAKSTFWDKLRGEGYFTEEEQKKIATISGRPLEELFPCKG